MDLQSCSEKISIYPISGRETGISFSDAKAGLEWFRRHPEVKWAQRLDKVYITVQLPDARDVKVNLEPDGSFTFSATAGAGNNTYELQMDLFDKVNKENFGNMGGDAMDDDFEDSDDEGQAEKTEDAQKSGDAETTGEASSEAKTETSAST
ncbi:CS domain [Musa troglodytarum]|uniref:Co-chaperone protein p23 n=1 Tax=Musa troglodytarum TaxID=320322 RepID=A0A9E7L015_9LILI|nr:CS domain [Musa troglodytarum]